MDIRQWGLDQIMQLPDECFGRRFMVSCNLDVGAAMRKWDISEVAFPNMCVIWELYIAAMDGVTLGGTLRIALGDQLPVAVAMFDALDPLFMGLGMQGPEPRGLFLPPRALLHLDKLRMPVAAQGRRMVVEGLTADSMIIKLLVAVVVSSVPTEVPDWLISENLRSR